MQFTSLYGAEQSGVGRGWNCRLERRSDPAAVVVRKEMREFLLLVGEKSNDIIHRSYGQESLINMVDAFRSLKLFFCIELGKKGLKASFILYFNNNFLIGLLNSKIHIKEKCVYAKKF